MSACCVSGCKNRHSSTSKLRFYRIPAGSRPFQANRRRLWLQAIERVNGSTEGLNGNARICGAHFKSQEASMDHDSPDFVPSVFTCAEQSLKKKAKRYYGRRKRRRRTAKTNKEEEEEEIVPLRADSPLDLQSSDLTEEIQTSLSPSEPKEGETWTEKAETQSETTPVKSQTTSPSADFSILDKSIPIVLLKRVFVPAGGYQCEHCNQNFTNSPQLIKHRRVHEEEEEEEEEDSTFICESCGNVFTGQADFTEHQCVPEPSFPCNICDRTFTTSQNLKRHKLLHVKDGRKCHQCGMLFCQRHNHVVFTPLAQSVTEYEEDPASTEPQNLDADYHLLENPEPSPTADLDDDAQSSVTVLPIPPNHKAQYPASSQASHTRVLPDIPPPVFLILPPVSSLPPPVPRITSKSPASSQFKTPLPKYPVASIQPPPPPNLRLPPSLKLFSPQYLTSAFLEVNRNYDYILSKPAGVKKRKNIVRKEQCEAPWISPHEQSVECVKKERTAYEMEFVL